MNNKVEEKIKTAIILPCTIYVAISIDLLFPNRIFYIYE